MLPANEVASINPVVGNSPAESAWARKLGVYAGIQADAVASPPPLYTLNDGFLIIVDNRKKRKFHAHDGGHGSKWEREKDYPEDFGALHYDRDVEELETKNHSHGAYAEFKLKHNEPGDYEVLLHCPRVWFLGNSVTHQIFDGDDLIDTVQVDQTVAQEDFQYDGLWWQRLGVYTFHDDKVFVRVLDTPISGDSIVADAVMLRSRRSFESVSSVSTTPNGGATVTVELN